MSSPLETLRQVQPKEVMETICGFLSTVAAGFLIIFYFRPALINEFDVAKITIMATALSLPVVVCNLFIVALMSINNKNNGPHLFRPVLFASMVISFFMLYSCLIIAWWFYWPFRSFAVFLLFLEALFGFVAMVVFKLKKKKVADEKSK